MRRSPRKDINILYSESHGYLQICFFPFSHLEKTSIFLAWNSKFLTWVDAKLSKRKRREHFIHLHCVITITTVVNFAKKNANYLHSVIFTQKQVHIIIIFYPSCEPLGRRGFSTKDCMLPACDNLSNVE